MENYCVRQPGERILFESFQIRPAGFMMSRGHNEPERLSDQKRAGHPAEIRDF